MIPASSYDLRDRPHLSGSMIEYHVPSAEDVPAFELDSTVTLTNTNPLGVKGIGEAGTVGAFGAVANAVADAVRPHGAKLTRLPYSPARIFEALSRS